MGLPADDDVLDFRDRAILKLRSLGPQARALVGRVEEFQEHGILTGAYEIRQALSPCDDQAHARAIARWLCHQQNSTFHPFRLRVLTGR
jgi:hypothetical protein